MAKAEEALQKLNQMREEEGKGIDKELRSRLDHIQKAAAGIEKHRKAILQTYAEKLKTRLQELLGSQVDPDRILQEAALLVDRSDIQEELVRLDTHVKHFLGMLDQGGELGKKLDFLLQEMNREANTLLVENFWPRGRSIEHHRTRTGHQVRDRESPRAGAEHRMIGIYIISAPSGSGKSTLVNEIRKIVPGLEFSVSYTTRPPRGSEQNGREYFFVTRPEFEAMLRKDEFLEHADVFGNYYGTARRFLREAAEKEHDLLLDIDVQGAAQIKQKLPEAVSIFILPPDRKILEWRLRNRSLDSEEVIQRRLVTATREIENYSKYDYILVNDRLEESTESLRSVLLAERFKRTGSLGTTPDPGILTLAERCRLENVQERLKPILDSFRSSDGAASS